MGSTQSTWVCDIETGEGCELVSNDVLERHEMPCGNGGGLPPKDGNRRRLCLPPEEWLDENCEEGEAPEDCESRKGSSGELDNEGVDVLLQYLHPDGAKLNT